MDDFMKNAINPGRDPIERQMIISEAIWELLKEKTGLTDEDLVKKVREIDLRDGVLDGRVKPEPPVACPKCNKKMKKGSSTCVYCGHIIPADVFSR
ncbi:zinc ribbon domain-containing protein [Acetivibrio saccincola]|jgi:hypothetical protein|uniref:Uncharacterized protein n=1 Tax=Acetivibrio saccincola TaxID=1677857 RepID=A0A2S8R842_9FIRM|nr:zinc ribbon domain-containing protein [Acetivibrio saccincola]NLW27963.1 hypothetical protein [Acetivibrio saccincola]PQQ65947.1 hypothetical protein B9R14_03645 [Acetivibrio saccincola]HOA96627.1 zinc ribbon domain-containing protein [Acetivibrio saccincola]HQD28205.1 zinc ribbon domain-containing protein [Acetivibrio saccincola]